MKELREMRCVCVLRKRGERTGRGKDTHKLTSQARILYIIISEEERRIDRLIFTFKNSRICFSSHTQRVERERGERKGSTCHRLWILSVLSWSSGIHTRGFDLLCCGHLPTNLPT